MISTSGKRLLSKVEQGEKSMSAIGLILALVVAGIAAGVHALISGGWDWRSFVALWVAFVLILVLPGVIHP